jgi:phosphate transport system substrate-binding protein
MRFGFVGGSAHGALAQTLGLALGLAVIAAGGDARSTEQNQPPPAQGAVTISGAGASFPYPIYSQWANAYKEKTGVQVNYQSIGSGGGIKQISSGTVDFGASDAPLEPQDLQSRGLVQWPMLVGGVVPVVNIPGVQTGTLKLTPDVLAGLFMGEIKKWNDPRLAADNPGIKLPDQSVTVVHRSDGSGTTWIFTNYLAKVSPAWKGKAGTGTAVSWPTGVGGKGNEGVASYVGRLPGSIGYVEYAYALQNHMTTAQLKNHDGNFVTASAKSFEAAAANAPWKESPSFYVVLTDQPGAETWPITGATFLLMKAAPPDANRARAVLDFANWAFQNGGEMASKLDYVPLPAPVIQTVEQSWDKIQGPDGKPVWQSSH